VPFIDVNILGVVGKLLFWLRLNAVGSPLLPHSCRVVVGLPNDFSVNYRSCPISSDLKPIPSWESFGLPRVPGVVEGATTKHLMKVYDGAVLCPRNLLALDAVGMDSQLSFLERDEVVSSGDHDSACVLIAVWHFERMLCLKSHFQVKPLHHSCFLCPRLLLRRPGRHGPV
jgi:hypothetical protein